MTIDKKTLRYRYLVPLYLSNVTEGICQTIILIFVPLYVRRTFAGTNLITVTSIVAIPFCAMFLASNFWGALADYTRRLKPFLIIGLAGYAACLFLLGSSGSSFSAVLTTTVSALFYAAVRPISQSYVTLLREGEKGRAIGDLMAFQSLGWVIGGVPCGYLFGSGMGISVQTALLGAAIFGTVVTVLVAGILKPITLIRNRKPEKELEGERGRENGAGKRSWFEGLASDLRALYGSRALVTTCVLACVTTAGTWVFFGSFSVFMTEHAGGSTALVGWAMALSALFGMLSFTPAGKLVDAIGPLRVFSIAVVSYVIIYGLVSITTSMIMLFIYFCIPAYPPLNVSLAALVSELTGENRRAGGLGILNGVLAISLAAGTMLGGVLGEFSGLGALPRWTFGAQILCLAGIIISVKWLKTLSVDSGRALKYEPAGQAV